MRLNNPRGLEPWPQEAGGSSTIVVVDAPRSEPQRQPHCTRVRNEKPGYP